jgi:light-harvesting protein B-800-850 alpha chain
MNEGRIWLYVSPSVGIPLFFIAVAAVALIVHASILVNTSWFGNYWQGAAATATVTTAVVEETTVAPAADAMAPAAEAAPAQ